MKLVEHIKAVETGNRRPIEEPLYKIVLTVDSPPTYKFNYAREYAITVTLGANQWIAEDLIKQAGVRVIEQAVDEMKHAIVEAVYGELRRDLMDLHREMRNELNYYDSKSIKKLVKIVEKITL
jgi:hypothetical protein